MGGAQSSGGGSCDWYGKSFEVEVHKDNNYKCGGDYQGGSNCTHYCCDAQIQYCKNSCGVTTIFGGPDACLKKCMEDRNCKSNHIRMHHWFYHVNPNQSISHCDSTSIRPPSTKSLCCDKQRTYCNGSCVGGWVGAAACVPYATGKAAVDWKKSWKQHYDSCYNKLWNDWCKEHQKKCMGERGC